MKNKSLHVVNNKLSENKSLCSFCSDNNHKLGNCKQFADEQLSSRRNFVQNSGLCFNCLGANHSVSSCRLPTRCKICNKKHHSLLHVNLPTDDILTDKHSAGNSNVVATVTNLSQDEIQVENLTSCFTNNKSQIVLATALVKAETKTGSYITCRSLLDQGS